jgi:hypothetical protein
LWHIHEYEKTTTRPSVRAKGGTPTNTTNEEKNKNTMEQELSDNVSKEVNDART